MIILFYREAGGAQEAKSLGPGRTCGTARTRLQSLLPRPHHDGLVQVTRHMAEGAKGHREGRRRKVEKTLDLMTEGPPCALLGGGV